MKNVISAVVAAVKARFATATTSPSDAELVAQLERQRITRLRTRDAFPNYIVASKLDSYAVWYKKVLDVREQRNSTRFARAGYKPLSIATHELLAQAYAREAV